MPNYIIKVECMSINFKRFLKVFIHSKKGIAYKEKATAIPRLLYLFYDDLFVLRERKKERRDLRGDLCQQEVVY